MWMSERGCTQNARAFLGRDPRQVPIACSLRQRFRGDDALRMRTYTLACSVLLFAVGACAEPAALASPEAPVSGAPEGDPLATGANGSANGQLSPPTPNAPANAAASGGDQRSASSDSMDGGPGRPTEPDDPTDPSVLPTAGYPGRYWAMKAERSIERDGIVVKTHDVTVGRMSWIQLSVYDQRYPLRVDIVSDIFAPPKRVVYMLPGGGTNFTASFLSRAEGGLANFFRVHDYLVIGVTPREDSVPDGEKDLSFMKYWGMEQHREDIRSVVTKVQAAVPANYEMAGHSYGAASALDYASHFPDEPRRVIALDIYSIDPDADRAGIKRARRTRDAYEELIAEGTYADTSYQEFGSVAREGLTDGGMDADSAWDRYTSKQLLLFGLVYSSVLPGVHSSITGLPGDWPMASSGAANEYDDTGVDPENDRRLLRRTSLTTLRAAAEFMGSGLISMAFARDYWSVVALGHGYTLPYAKIACPVIWLNSELGYADQMFGARLVRESGNLRVTTAVIPDYGHVDMIYGNTAREDVWDRLF